MLYCRFKCLSSLKTGRFWLDVNVFIVYKMEKIVLKEIPTILFVCIVIVVWTFPIVIIESLLKMYSYSYSYCYKSVNWNWSSQQTTWTNCCLNCESIVGYCWNQNSQWDILVYEILFSLFTDWLFISQCVIKNT